MSKYTLIGWMLLLATLGCASTPSGVAHTPNQDEGAVRVTDQNADATRRQFRAASPGTDRYEALRWGLVGYLDKETPGILADNDYAALITHFAAYTSLYTPEEVAAGQLPKGLIPVCKAVIEQGSPKADEGAVLAALLVLSKLEPTKDAQATNDKNEPAKYYARLKEWSISARNVLPDPLGYENELIEVWERHARLAPTPEVLKLLSESYIHERSSFMQRFQMAEGRFPLSSHDLEHIQQTSYAIAAVHLRVGDVPGALDQLKSAGAAANLDARMIELLEQATQDDSDGADALLALASAPGFRKDMPEVAMAVCQLGQRQHPLDARFPACLGNMAAMAGDVEGMVSYYDHATTIAPDSSELQDVYLLDLYNVMSSSEPDANMARVNHIADHLTQVLETRLKRWPDRSPPISAAKLYLALGLSEMNTGQANDAEQHLRRSLELEPDATTHLQLGNLLSRLGQPDRAAAEYEAALKVTSDEEKVQRAELLERLGDARRIGGSPEIADKHYAESLAVWDELLERLKGPQAGFAEVRRGVLLSRLQKRAEAHRAFQSALTQAPGVAETYKGILAHLVVNDPDKELALRVFHHAQRQLQLEPEWKVYLALWLQIVQGPDSDSSMAEAKDLLEDFSGKNTWWSQLASFGAGRTSYDALLEQAHDRGQKAEAIFYEGARRLRGGDTHGAREQFEQVLATNMVNFYEFIMAQELLRTDDLANTPQPATTESRPADAPSATSTTPATAPVQKKVVDSSPSPQAAN